MSAAVPLRNCTAQELDEENHIETIFKLAQDAGKLIIFKLYNIYYIIYHICF